LHPSAAFDGGRGQRLVTVDHEIAVDVSGVVTAGAIIDALLRAIEPVAALSAV